MDEDRRARQLIGPEPEMATAQARSRGGLCAPSAATSGADSQLAHAWRRLGLRRIPIPSFAQAFFEIDRRFVSKRLRGQGNIGLRVANVALARRTVFWRGLTPRESLQQLQRIVERVTPARSKIKGAAGEAWRLAGLQIRRHQMVDKREIARLLSVSKNGRLAAIAHGGYKQRKYAGVRRTGILARPKDVEIAESDEIESVGAVKYAAVEFADEFGNAVGRNGRRRHAFMLWQRWRVAINRGRAGEDDAANSGISRGDENVECAIHVDLVGLQRLLYRARHGSARREMDDVIGAAAGFFNRFAGGDGAVN